MDMLCAGGEQGKDACHVSNMSKLLSATPSSSSTTVQGDSGGPLTVEVAGRHTLAGIVSFGAVCGQVRIGLYRLAKCDPQEGSYGVYTKTAAFRDWIEATMAEKGGSTFCTLASGGYNGVRVHHCRGE